MSAGKPVDAASLVVTRTGKGGRIELLLGQRSARSSFMPGIFVMPGGRVEPRDYLAGPISALRENVVLRLMRRASRSLSYALVRSALRETFEETGFLFGIPSDDAALISIPGLCELSAHYCRLKIFPPFSQIDYIVRALTPTSRGRRFNTRFFLLHNPPIQERVGLGDGELEKVGWYPLEETGDMEMARITPMVIAEASRIVQSSLLHDRPGTLRIFHAHGRKQFAEE